LVTPSARRWCFSSIVQWPCRMGLKGTVSKRLNAPYRSGPSRDWLKIKNPDSPAMIRARGACAIARHGQTERRVFGELHRRLWYD
jgi:ATP-dependent DNA ligase